MSGHNLKWSVEKRIEFIEFQLYWTGQINRSDITEKFDVSVPQASKDISLYKEAAPDNLWYDPREKRYYISDKFIPRFSVPNASAYLWQMRDDVHAMIGNDVIQGLPSHEIVRMPVRKIDPNVLKQIVDAIRNLKSVAINYQSMSSDDPMMREISPHSFAFNGSRWHIRAYCHKRKEYRDFLLSRIINIHESPVPYIPANKDDDWNEYFNLILKPHPKLSAAQARIVADDYNMKEGLLEIPVRKCLLYYLLRRLELNNVDDENCNPKEVHVVVANKKETDQMMEQLKGVRAKSE